MSSVGVPPGEPPLYRPFGLPAFGTTVLAGSPLGTWALYRLYLRGGQVTPEWLWLHAHLQVFGFFGVLLGVVLRSAEVLADSGWESVLGWLPVSGALAWTALACVTANLLGAILSRRRAPRSGPPGQRAASTR